MSGVALVLAIALGLFFSLLLIPIRFRGQGQMEKTVAGYAEVSGLFGIAEVRASKVIGSSSETKIRLGWWSKSISTREPHKPAAHKTKSKRKGVKSFINRDIWSALSNYLKKILISLHLEISLEGEYGTGDPALTGFLCCLIAAIVGNRRGITLIPDFMEEVLRIEGEFKGRFFPIMILWHSVVLLLSSPIRTLWWPKFYIRKNNLQEVVGNV